MFNSLNSYAPIIKEPKATWKNKHMVGYYENISVEAIRNFAIQGGFDNGCDIDIIFSYIAHTRSLIDAGAAYGRVIKNLIRNSYQGKIYAIERSKNLYQYLKTHYADKAEIILADIQNFKPLQKVDAILWMWSGIGDFAKDEQLLMLSKMCTWLKPNGIFVLETILHTLIPTNATVNNDQDFIISSEYGTLYGYKSSIDEINFYGKSLGFNYIKHINYETATKRQRIVHIFSNSPI